MRLRRAVTGLAVVGVAIVAALGLAGNVAAGDPVCGNGDASVTNTCTYSSTGSEDTFTVPAAGVTSIHVALVGGQGGSGGFGATVGADLTVTSGEVLYVAVGGNGGNPGSCGPGGAGGFNGGGTGGAGGGGCASGGAGGAGASDLRTCSRSAGSCSGGGTSLDSRLLVAGGGGGSGSYGNDFCGGGGGGGAGDTDGSAGSDPCNPGSGSGGSSGENGGTGGARGNNSGVLFGGTGGDGSAGTGGTGGSGVGNTCCGGGGGGGGGGYVGGGGGGGGANAVSGGGGGGGSSYVDASASNGSIGTDATGTPSITITYTVITDHDPPAVTVSFSPNGSNGWFKTSSAGGTVTADDSSNGGSNITDIQCTGAAVGAISGLGTTSASAPITVSSQGTTNVSCTATDSATNNGAGPGSSATASVKLDSVAPGVSLNAGANSCGTPGSSGWCKGAQTAGFTATDSTSGVTSPCSGASCNFTQSTSTNGGSVSIASGSVCDVAGNCNSGINATGFKIDGVAPSVSRNAGADSCGTPGNSGWCKGTQTAGFTGSDSTSGVTSPCSGASCNFTQSTSTNGGSVSIASGSVCDVAGNCNAGINATGFKIDTVAPSLGITQVSAPADGTLTAQNFSSFPATVGAQPVTLSGSDSDGTSGISSVVVESGAASLGSGTWTKGSLALSGGANTLHVTVTDVAGNTTSSTAGVTLNLDLDADGIANNIDQSPSSASVAFSDVARGGSTSGTIVSVGTGMAVTIVDAASPQGVQVTVTGPAAGRVKLQMTGKGSITSLAPGTYIETDPDVSTTLETISGLGEFQFTLNGSTTLVDVPTGAAAELTETLTNGVLTQAVVGAEQGTITINGQPVVAGTTLVLGKLTNNSLTVAKGKFSYFGTFTLGQTSNGINPLTEFVGVQLGPVSCSFAPGSFKKGAGGFTANGTCGTVKVSVVLTPVTSTKYTVNISGSPSPSLPAQVPVQILVGDDSASTTVAKH